MKEVKDDRTSTPIRVHKPRRVRKLPLVRDQIDVRQADSSALIDFGYSQPMRRS